MANIRRTALERPPSTALATAPATALATARGRSENVLLWAVRFCVALLLLSPFVVSAGTVFPYVVGKALYCRVLIELAFVFWALLAVVNPSFRPPRSWLLVLLALGLVAAAVAAWFGVSWQRSVWSNYERMQGLIEVVHWFACAVVVVSTFRSGENLRWLLNLHLAASLAVILLAVASFARLDLPFYGLFTERYYPRVGASLGNATYLGAYGLVNFIVALGLLARSFAERGGRVAPLSAVLAARSFWALAAALNFTGLLLSGAVGSLVALVATVLLFMVVCVFLARALVVRLAIVAAIAGVGFGAAYGTVVLQSGAATDGWAANPMLQRLAIAGAEDRSYQQRVFAMQAGALGFAERPLLGWGPENFGVVFGRYLQDVSMEPHDNAHNKLIEEASTKGLSGVVSYVALWGFAGYVFLRAALRAKSGERAFALAMGAALASHVVNAQALFDTAVLNLLSVLLLAYGVHWEVEARASQAASSAPRTRGRLALRVSLATVAFAVVVAGLGVGLWANRKIYVAASAAAVGVSSGPTVGLERSVAEFEPLAGFPRRLFFIRLATEWESLRVRDGVEARRRLRLADAYAAAAIASEPDNWRLHQELAAMYRKVALTEPEYAATAQRHGERLMQLAPAMRPATRDLDDELD